MSITLLSLTDSLQAIGNATVFVGDPFTASGMEPLGAKEGEISVAIEESYNDLTAPEQTGPAVHERTLMGVSAAITVPIILGDEDLYAKIYGSGSKSGGWSSPQAVVPTSVLVIPNNEVGGGLANATGATSGWVRTAGNGVLGATGAGAAPVHAVWLWRAVPTAGPRPYSIDNGGKVLITVTFTAMFDGDRPEGHKLYTTGDPAAQGITTIRI